MDQVGYPTLFASDVRLMCIWVDQPFIFYLIDHGAASFMSSIVFVTVKR
jgi:hypothetical protein